MFFVGGTLSASSWQAQAGEQSRFACRVGVSNCLALRLTPSLREAKRRSNPSIRYAVLLLRFARNDGERAPLLRSTQRRQQARHQTATLGEAVDLDMFVERMSVGATNAQAIQGGYAHGARKIAVRAAAGAAVREF